MDDYLQEPFFELGDRHAYLRIRLTAPYGPHLADLDTSDYRDALFEIKCYPFDVTAETTFTGGELDQLRDLFATYTAGDDIVFEELKQFRLALAHQDGARTLVTVTPSAEGGRYPELRYVVHGPRAGTTGA